MPLVPHSSYRAPLGFKSGHLQSIFPAIFRRVAMVTTRRERIETPDDDFLDLDWSPQRSRRLAILTHGLEGDASQPYIQGMAAALQARGWDILAWNFRGCSGEPNRRVYSYHSGATGDLQTVLDHVVSHHTTYGTIALVGFSLGGNITLKYLGDQGETADPKITAAVAFSVPCDLAASAAKMAGFGQRLYMRRFLKCLRGKIREKVASHPGQVDGEGLDAMRTFREFDEKYTAPLNGFEGAEDYWARCSCKPVLALIRVPCLLVNAQDDPFLTPDCHPCAEAAVSDQLFFENPPHGGHVGFVPHDRSGEFWSETRAAEFLENAVSSCRRLGVPTHPALNPKGH